jgi:cell division inhibitor SulA
MFANIYGVKHQSKWNALSNWPIVSHVWVLQSGVTQRHVMPLLCLGSRAMRSKLDTSGRALVDGRYKAISLVDP